MFSQINRARVVTARESQVEGQVAPKNSIKSKHFSDQNGAIKTLGFRALAYSLQELHGLTVSDETDMPRRSEGRMLLTLNLARDRRETLQRQIFAQIRDAILAGRLPPGTELPPSRVLASEYGISRNTVLQVYQWLTAEGYVETERSARTLVSENLPKECLSVDRGDVGGRQKGRGREPQKTDIVFRGTATCSAGSGIGAERRSILARPPKSKALSGSASAKLALIDRMSTAGRDLTEYGDAFGMRELREAIALHLEAARGLLCYARTDRHHFRNRKSVEHRQPAVRHARYRGAGREPLLSQRGGACSKAMARGSVRSTLIGRGRSSIR